MQDTTVLLADFFAQDDLARLTADAGELLDCPLMVIDDAFRVAAHYAPPGFADPLFDRAVQQGAITYEAGAIISRSPALYRIHKMREDFAVPLDDPAAHTALLSTALTLLDSKGAEFFVDGSEGSTSAKG